jgi:4-oxalomesaconate tautomerase
MRINTKYNGLIFFLLSLTIFISSCKTSSKSTALSLLDEKKVPCVYMRGGTSKGPFFDMRDLPSDIKKRNQILLDVMGSPDPKQIDGLGAVETVTSKVVMAQPSKRKGIDVDYLFAQIDIAKPVVDTTPPCGNMMAGVGPFAIEKGWVKAQIPETRVMVYNINTNSVIEEVVQTPYGRVIYDGNMKIDGVPGTAAPVMMNLLDQVGVKTGKLLPTGNVVDVINDIEVSIVDAGSLMVLIKASDLNLIGNEQGDYFNQNSDLMSKIEQIRLKAGILCGLGDVSNSVIPKVAILSKPTLDHTNITSRYLTPHTLHPSHAVTGAICISTALKIQGSVASKVGISNGKAQELIFIEHPSGIIEINIETEGEGKNLKVNRAGSVRTVRKIMEGYVYYK